MLVDPAGRVELFKTPSTPDDPPAAIRTGIGLISEHLGVGVKELLGGCEMIIHGTTVALNALIQLKGAKVGLLCTRGHEDSLEIRNGHKEDGHRYDFRYPAAEMLVLGAAGAGHRTRCRATGACARRSSRGTSCRGSRSSGARGSRRSVSRFSGRSFTRSTSGVRASSSPRRCRESHVTLSVDLLPQIREYTRTSTVAVNAYVQPRLARYVEAIEEMLAGLGYRGPLRYVQSNGGLTSGRVFVQRAVSALNSGPAAGPSASLHFAARLGRQRAAHARHGRDELGHLADAPDGRVDS